MPSLPEDPLSSEYVYYYKTDADGWAYKLVAYMEKDKEKAEKDGGSALRYYEAFTHRPEKEQVHFTGNPAEDDSDYLDTKMPGYIPYTLTATKSGSGDGTITSNPAGINCGFDCSEDYEENTSVTLTATENATSSFAGWSGEGCTGTGTCTVTMDDAKNVYAQFDIISTDHTLTIFRKQDNETTGTVTSDPPGINCDSNWSDCSELYSSGTIVTLTATRGSSGFVSWTGDCSGSTGCPSGASSLTCTVTMDADKSVNVNFGGCVGAF